MASTTARASRTRVTPFGRRRRHHEYGLALARRASAKALDLDDLFLERDLQLVGVDDPPVIPERFEPRRLLVGADQRQAADLQQLRRGEEHHVHRELEDGVDEDALLDDRVIEPLLLGGDSGGEPGGASAYNKHVSNGHKG